MMFVQLTEEAMSVFRSLMSLIMVLVLASGTALAATAVEERVNANNDLVRRFLDEGRYQDALELLKENQRIDPDNYIHHRAEAVLFVRYMTAVRSSQGVEAATPYYQMAAQAFRRSILLADEAGEPPYLVSALHYEFADTAFGMGDMETATEQVSRSLLLFPAARNNNLAGKILLNEMRRTGESEEKYERMIAFFENAVLENEQYGHPIFEAYYYTAEAKVREGDFETADQRLKKLRQVAENHGLLESVSGILTPIEAYLESVRR